jgi:hypothetical protein
MKDQVWASPLIGDLQKPAPDRDEQLAGEIRSQLDISEVIGRHVQLRSFGASQKGVCPFCEVNPPTFHIASDSRRWYCLGPCDMGGDVIDFVMLADGVNYNEAIRQIAARTGISAPDTSGRPDRSSRSTFRSLLARYGSMGSLPEMNCRRADRSPVAGNLAYPLRMGIRKEQPGLVTSLYPNLQEHLEIEYPSGATAIVDSEAFRDAGAVIWTDTGTAILKDLESGEHCLDEIQVMGVTTRGFCLLRAPSQLEYTWFPPRRPGEVGDANRMVLLNEGARERAWALETFSVDPEVLSSYHDLSGEVVRLQTPQRSIRRHGDHLASH